VTIISEIYVFVIQKKMLPDWAAFFIIQ